VTGVRIVLTHRIFSLRGEVTMTGGALPAGQRLFASAKSTDLSPRMSYHSAQVDARGQFIIEGLTQGEYEVAVEPLQAYGAGPIDARVARAFRSARQKVNVNSDSQRVTFTVDLGRKEENR
jgi:hypothetical protein